MNKYYITCGDVKRLILAESPEDACLSMFSSMPEANRLSREIRISQKGHEVHHDDTVLSLSDMFYLWIISLSRDNNDL